MYEILGISLCHLAKQKPKTIYLNFPFLVDRQLRTFFLHTDTINFFRNLGKKNIWPGIKIVHRISFLDDVFFIDRYSDSVDCFSSKYSHIYSMIFGLMNDNEMLIWILRIVLQK